MKKLNTILFLSFITLFSYGQRAITQQIIGPPTLQFVTEQGNTTTLGAFFGDTVSGSDPILDQNFVTKAYGDANYLGGGEWTADGNGITYSAGNVGIGAASHSTRSLYVSSTELHGIYVDNTGQTGARIATSNTGIGSTGVIGLALGSGSNVMYGGTFLANSSTGGIGINIQGAKSAILTGFNTAPSSTGDTGTAGEIRFTSTHIYICTASDTWKRVAISTW